MAEFERKTEIGAAPDEVFRFLSSIHSVPTFLPWIREIRAEPGDRFFAIFEENGKQREVDGIFRVNNEARRIEWGSETTPLYRGWAEITPRGERDSELAIHLLVERPEHREIEQMIDEVLGSIRRMIEEQGGGKVMGGGA